MKITVGNYTIEGSTYNWTLVKKEPYRNKKGEDKIRTETWYYPKIEQALNALIEGRLKDDTLDEDLRSKVGYVLSSIKGIKEEILEAIKN